MIMGWKTQYGKDVNVSQFCLDMWKNSTENTGLFMNDDKGILKCIEKNQRPRNRGGIPEEQEWGAGRGIELIVFKLAPKGGSKLSRT